jgi:hypothetical protein
VDACEIISKKICRKGRKGARNEGDCRSLIADEEAASSKGERRHLARSALHPAGHLFS